MVLIKGKTTSRTTVELTHESGSVIKTTAPKDNGGDGSSFSPTDLCAASLGACGATIMSMFCADKDIALDGIEFELRKEMSAAPRRIERITVAFRIKSRCTETAFKKIVAAGKTCPVRLTLGESVEIVESYERA